MQPLSLRGSFGVDYAVNYRFQGQGLRALTSFTRADGPDGGVGGFQGGVNDVLGSRIILEGIYRMANVGQGPGLVVGGRSFIRIYRTRSRMYTAFTTRRLQWCSVRGVHTTHVQSR
jgi:hypothetical protein